ncbi:lipase family protein [Enterobacter quasiroggenkampii]|nr:lipase family protein [Enterobacter quasiroggenkampii]
MKYAFEEVPALLRKLNGLPEDAPERQPLLAYICALFAEITYHHIPALEFDRKKRAKIMFSKAFRDLMTMDLSGGAVLFESLDQLYEEGEAEPPETGFIAQTENVIAVGLVFDKFLFIGFRGTIPTSLYDWGVNLYSKKMPLNPPTKLWPLNLCRDRKGLFHKGFVKETWRVCQKITEILLNEDINGIEHLYLTGHSLGGAIAAVSQEYFSYAGASVYTYGAPRYCNAEAYNTSPYNHPYLYRSSEDMVPTVPPLFLGYTDNPNEFALDGKNFALEDKQLASGWSGWKRFKRGGLKSHFMENYREELGRTANITDPARPLVPYLRIKRQDLK